MADLKSTKSDSNKLRLSLPSQSSNLSNFSGINTFSRFEPGIHPPPAIITYPPLHFDPIHQGILQNHSLLANPIPYYPPHYPAPTYLPYSVMPKIYSNISSHQALNEFHDAKLDQSNNQQKINQVLESHQHQQIKQKKVLESVEQQQPDSSEHEDDIDPLQQILALTNRNKQLEKELEACKLELQQQQKHKLNDFHKLTSEVHTQTDAAMVSERQLKSFLEEEKSRKFQEDKRGDFGRFRKPKEIKAFLEKEFVEAPGNKWAPEKKVWLAQKVCLTLEQIKKWHWERTKKEKNKLTTKERQKRTQKSKKE